MKESNQTRPSGSFLAVVLKLARWTPDPDGLVPQSRNRKETNVAAGNTTTTLSSPDVTETAETPTTPDTSCDQRQQKDTSVSAVLHENFSSSFLFTHPIICLCYNECIDGCVAQKQQHTHTESLSVCEWVGPAAADHRDPHVGVSQVVGKPEQQRLQQKTQHRTKLYTYNTSRVSDCGTWAKSSPRTRSVLSTRPSFLFTANQLSVTNSHERPTCPLLTWIKNSFNTPDKSNCEVQGVK